jgi:OmpA-OmpF porin, OOP family
MFGTNTHAKAVVCALLALSPGQLKADERLALNRFEPSEPGSRWFTADSLELSGSRKLALGVVTDWAHKPLVAYGADGEALTVMSRDQVFVHARGSVVIVDGVRVGVAVPLLVHQTGSVIDMAEGPYQVDEGVALGDVRLSGDLRIVGREGEAFTAAGGLVMYVPTGSREALAGENQPRLQPRFQVAGELGTFVYAARAGVLFRPRRASIADETIGSELMLGGAAGVQAIDRRLLVGPVFMLATPLQSDILSGWNTPFEAQLAASYDVGDDVRVGTAFGPGLSQGLGAPELRWLIAAEWDPAPPPPAPPPDTDGDGTPDVDDACPKVHGPPSADPKRSGCPPPLDRDGDGILDEADACPTDGGVASPDVRLNGCRPPPTPSAPSDTDQDGVVDAVDLCPTEAGGDGAPGQKKGCPAPLDADGDGTLDLEDACPSVAGALNDDPKKRGCPMVVVTDQRLEIFERIEFERGRTTIKAESDAVLSAVAAALRQNPRILRLSIEGHTDSQGSASRNRELSRQRAVAVVKWLIAHGIAANRLVGVGFGAAHPIDSNATNEGRKNNRRVEFRVVELEGQPGSGNESRTR